MSEDISVTFEQEKISEHHLDPFWYGGQNNAVATIRYKNRIVYVDAPGDIRIVEIGGQERVIRDMQDLTEEERSLGDHLFWLVNGDENPAFEWENNNWFELFWRFEDSNEIFAEEGEVCYDYDEAIGAGVSLIKNEGWWKERGAER